ncbi:MFS transporter [Peribacillus cavernae]|uniref:MFS transporter n=1 Tax=Peribacillus cavernae TaxID=1674310 RepID=A0A433HC61_9BACI|nr:MFS transporter [Peribacillus cavernae]MDQ0221039.1 sugar phosphate permease [Peribacillus cavernae]RUQ25816.1 MFS transporter [Peribacillus cavernae]
MNGKYRFVIMIMIVFITIINYADRGAISYAQADIIEEFGLDVKAWGAILGYFGYGYMFGALFGGILADKKGPKFVWLLVAAFWSIFEIGTAFAGNIGLMLFGGSALVGFALFRVLFGLAEGPIFATMNRTMANWAAPKEKAFAVSMGFLGGPVGALLTAPIAVGLISLGGWKFMFIFLGLLGVVWCVIWARMFTNRPEDHPKVSKEELAEIRSTEGLLKNETTLVQAEQARVPWYHFFKNPTLVFNSLAYFAFQYVNFLILTWTPKYLQDTFGFQLSSLWYLGMVPWIGACFTVLLGGYLSDYLRRKTGNLRIARSSLAFVSLLLTAICFTLIPTVNSVGAVLTLMAIGNAFNYLPANIYWTVVIDTEPSKAGTFGGVTHFIANTATIIAPTFTGVLVANSGYTAMFAAAAIVAGMGMLAMLFVKPGRNNQNNLETDQDSLPNSI